MKNLKIANFLAGLLYVGLAGIQVSAQSAVDTALQPHGAWTLNEEPHGCRIERQVGEATSPTNLAFSRRLNPLAVLADIYSPLPTSDLRTNGLIIEAGTVVVNSSIAWNPSLPQTADPDVLSRFDSLDAIPDDADRAQLVLRNGNRNILALDLDGVGAALVALRECQDRVYASLNIDVAAMRRIHVDATPANDPRLWVTTDDLPRQFRGMTAPLTTSVILHINARGGIDRCTVTQSSTEALLDVQACRMLIARARFRPARDIEGQPIATLDSRNVRWRAPPS